MKSKLITILSLTIATIAAIGLNACSTTQTEKINTTLESALPQVKADASLVTSGVLVLTQNNPKVIADAWAVIGAVRSVEGKAQPVAATANAIIGAFTTSGSPQIADLVSSVSAKLAAYAPLVKTAQDSIALGEAICDGIEAALPAQAGN